MLIRMVEMVLIFMILMSIVNLFLPGNNKKNKQSSPKQPPRRFDGEGYDISDGDYEDVGKDK